MPLFKRSNNRPQPPESAPAAPAQAMVRNDRLLEALSTWGQRKDSQVFADVIRRAVIGDLLLDITDSKVADPAAGWQQGDVIAITSQRDNAGKNLLVAFTDNDELARYRGRPGVSLVQSAVSVMEQAMCDYEGIVINGRSQGAFIAYSEEIRQNLGDDPAAAGRLAAKTIAHSMSFAEYIDELARGIVYIPLEVSRDAQGNRTGAILASALAADGSSCAVIGTSPAEVWAWDPRFDAQPTELAEVARSALENGQSGAILNPAGPTVFIDAEALTHVAGER